MHPVSAHHQSQTGGRRLSGTTSGTRVMELERRQADLRRQLREIEEAYARHQTSTLTMSHHRRGRTPDLVEDRRPQRRRSVGLESQDLLRHVEDHGNLDDPLAMLQGALSRALGNEVPVPASIPTQARPQTRVSEYRTPESLPNFGVRKSTLQRKSLSSSSKQSEQPRERLDRSLQRRRFSTPPQNTGRVLSIRELAAETTSSISRASSSTRSRSRRQTFQEREAPAVMRQRLLFQALKRSNSYAERVVLSERLRGVDPQKSG
ncbi:hypothetical protein GMRT_12753 [Giardia muris]|uniref:Uncharacterized protein n=1 Tax=Giardia muris TaxID=5742 RepID=A0A4Z1T7N9_GIAMU|nr:hypothetical protein GMRT_12753 [Giardia muris]|eukprot:TNJ28589.1 hypothetical protein GMRT_12753 [Giardia muris]